MKRKLNPMQERRIVERFMTGESASNVARLEGVDKWSVYRVLERNGLKPIANYKPGVPSSRSEEEEFRIIAMYLEPRSIASVSRELRIHKSTLRKLFHRRGVLRPDGKLKPFSQAVRLEMLKMWKQGRSQAAIGKQYGIDQTLVSRLLSKYGQVLERRNPRRESHGSWKGGISHTSGGYRKVIIEPNDSLYCMADSYGYALEHRLVLARELGRPLLSTETVHHKNGDRLDNRLENLELLQGKHGKGQIWVCADCGSHNIVAERFA